MVWLAGSSSRMYLMSDLRCDLNSVTAVAAVVVEIKLVAVACGLLFHLTPQGNCVRLQIRFAELVLFVSLLRCLQNNKNSLIKIDL